MVLSLKIPSPCTPSEVGGLEQEMVVLIEGRQCVSTILTITAIVKSVGWRGGGYSCHRRPLFGKNIVFSVAGLQPPHLYNYCISVILLQSRA